MRKLSARAPDYSAKDFGKLDIVFANAGITGRTPTGSTDEAIFENVIHTQPKWRFLCAEIGGMALSGP